MKPAPEALQADWLGVSRRAAEALRGILADAPTTAERVIETGERGEGGDRTLVIDRAAEDAVFSELERLATQGHRFTAVSEERGTVEFGSEDVIVVVDPIDGSLNAKRGLPHHCLSIAVADGPTVADVAFGYIYDYGPGEEWIARRGDGATVNGRLLEPAAGERRSRNGKLEVLGIESADPRWVAEYAAGLRDLAWRIRALGTIAVTLCQVADARLDAMLTLRGCRAVDAAAAVLIVRESGGHVAFPAFDDPLGAPLDLVPHSPLVAARTERAIEELSALLAG